MVRSLSKTHFFLLLSLISLLVLVFYIAPIFSGKIKLALALTSQEIQQQLNDCGKPGDNAASICRLLVLGSGNITDEDRRAYEKYRKSQGDDPFGSTMAKVALWGMTKVALLTALAGDLADRSINYTLGIGSKTKMLDSVESAWKIFRDLANMIFIFALLIIAIGTILQVSSFGAKQLLAKLIIAAVLVNFSLFATKVIIDVSNVLAANFYQAVTVNGKISEQFINTSKLLDAYGPGKTPQDSAKLLTSYTNLSGVAIVGAIFMLIMVFVFLAGAIMFIARTVVLIFLMILSPLAFVGMVLPYTKVYAQKWWSTLLSQAFLAPIYLLLIYVSLQIMSSLELSGEKFVENIVAGKGDWVLNYSLVVGFALATLVISKSVGGWAASAGLTLANKSFAFAGRNTIGRTLGLLGQSDIARGMVKNSQFGIGRALVRGLRGGGRASYSPGGLPGAGFLGLKNEGAGGWQKGKDLQRKRIEEEARFVGKEGEAAYAKSQGSLINRLLFGSGQYAKKKEGEAKREKRNDRDKKSASEQEGDLRVKEMRLEATLGELARAVATGVGNTTELKKVAQLQEQAVAQARTQTSLTKQGIADYRSDKSTKEIGSKIRDEAGSGGANNT